MDDAPRRAPAKVPRVSTAPDPLVGRVINDRYRIVGLIARGGMGKVYRAEQAPLGRLVGMKVLNPNYTGDSDPEFHKRFFLEASIASKLTHPNTVTIFDYGRTDDDIYFIAMELLEGRTLYRALRESRPFPAEGAMHIGRQICRSLREAHALGVIHRDLKPANVYLVQHGDESDFVKVLDFGLVKDLDAKGEELTKNGLFMGSPKYMSPEQIRGDRVDIRVDIYSLGVILYEMLTGKVPFDRANSVNILMAHVQERVPPMSEINPDVQIPAQLEEVVNRCMAKKTDDRYANMDEVLLALKRCAGIPILMSGERALTGEFMAPAIGSEIELRGSAAVPLPASAPLPAAAMPPQRVAPARRAPSKAPYIMLFLAAAGALTIMLVARRRALPPAAQAPTVVMSPAQPGVVSARDPATTLGMDVQGVVPTVLVSLRSTPSGATVVVGEKEYGPTPTQVEWSGPEARPGREVTFRFQRKGYRDLTVTRTVRGDRLVVEAPPLDPIPVRRATPTPVAPRRKEVRPAPPIPDGYKAEPY